MALLLLSCGSTFAEQAASRPFTPEAFDRMAAAVTGARSRRPLTASDIAWGESYVMVAYVEMYRATKETRYLDKLIEHADRVLAARDDVRGFKDYEGRSRAAWSVGGEYTVAELVLRNGRGQDVLRLRSVPYAYNNQTKVRVAPSTQPAGEGRFDLQIANEKWPPAEAFRGLSMDPASPDFVERRVNACAHTALERKLACSEQGGSKLVTVQVLQSDAMRAGVGTSPATSDQAMKPLFMAYHGYSGQATYGMLEFARVVREDPTLQARYGSIGDRFLAEAVRVFEDAEEEWREGPQPEQGHYVTGRRGCPFWSDGLPKAHNYQASLGRSLVLLGRLTGEERWTSHAQGIARLIRDHLRPTDNRGYVWNYWWGIAERGWDREHSPSFNTPTWAKYSRVEDTSHGHLDVDFACLAAAEGCVFTEADMQRFARTLLGRMVNRERWTLSVQVDGTGGWGTHDGVLGGYMELARWEPQVAEAAFRIGEAQGLHQKAGGGGAMMTLARLVKWSRQ